MYFSLSCNRLSEVEYSNISDKFDEHEARHQELQRYIKLVSILKINFVKLRILTTFG